MSILEKAEIVKLFEDLRPYVRHARTCPYTQHINSDPDSDFCTCDFNNVVKKIIRFLSKIKNEQNITRTS